MERGMSNHQNVTATLTAAYADAFIILCVPARVAMERGMREPQRAIQLTFPVLLAIFA